MFTRTAFLLAAATIALGSAALSPAKANYDYCSENPSAKGCPGNFEVTNEPFYTAPHAARSAQHERTAPPVTTASTRRSD